MGSQPSHPLSDVGHRSRLDPDDPESLVTVLGLAVQIQSSTIPEDVQDGKISLTPMTQPFVNSNISKP